MQILILCTAVSYLSTAIGAVAWMGILLVSPRLMIRLTDLLAWRINMSGSMLFNSSGDLATAGLWEMCSLSMLIPLSSQDISDKELYSLSSS